MGVFLAGSDRWQIKPLPGGTKPAGVPPPSSTPPPRCPDRGSGRGRDGLRRGLRATGLAFGSTVFTVQTPPHAVPIFIMVIRGSLDNRRTDSPRCTSSQDDKRGRSWAQSEICKSNKHEEPIYTSKRRRVKIHFRGGSSWSIPGGKCLAGTAPKLKVFWKKAQIYVLSFVPKWKCTFDVLRSKSPFM